MNALSVYLSYDPADAAAVEHLRIALEGGGATVIERRPDAMNDCARIVVCFSRGDGDAARFNAEELRRAERRMRRASAGERPVLAVKLVPCELPLIGDDDDSEIEVLQLPLPWRSFVERITVSRTAATGRRIELSMTTGDLSVDGNLSDVGIEGPVGSPGADVRIERKSGNVAVARDASFVGMRTDVPAGATEK
jgi:hypothetical protein